MQKLGDEDWISDLALLTDIPEHFNNLNRSLQENFRIIV